MTHNVMIVDDSNMMRTVVTNFINQMPGFTVTATAENGRKALEKLETNKDISIILLDIEMPEMDGLEFLRHAKMKSKAKVVILSSVAVSGSSYTARAKALGADAIVSKPSGAVSYDLLEKRAQELTNVMKLLVA